MRFFKKFVGFLGFGKEDDNSNPNSTNDNNNNNNSNLNNTNNSNNNDNSDDSRVNRKNVDPVQMGPRRGFSVPVQVPVERPTVGPILMPCNGDGGLQGFQWYTEGLRVDEDGDIADEFFDEVPPDLSHHSHLTIPDQSKPIPRFQVKSYEKRPRVVDRKVTSDGKFQHLVVFQGRKHWV